MNIFDKRVAFKPFEYPEMLDFVDAINHSYWLHTKWNFHSDIQDFNVKLNDVERNAIKNTLLAISQIEISVKTFWGDLYRHFPKPEFAAVGFTFAESEVRHERSYSHLLEVLHLNHDFKLLLENPVIQGRIDYLNKYLKNAGSDDRQVYTLTLALFSLFIENVSLFSQFAIIKAFNKKKGLLKDIENVVQATQKEEQLHGLLGATIINLIKKEFPDWFDKSFHRTIKHACRKAYAAELNIIKWIFEEGELDFISIPMLDEFIKFRFNESLEMIGCEAIFETDAEILKEMKWFDEGVKLQTSVDFFHQKSNNYSKNMVSVTANDLF